MKTVASPVVLRTRAVIIPFTLTCLRSLGYIHASTTLTTFHELNIHLRQYEACLPKFWINLSSWRCSEIWPELAAFWSTVIQMNSYWEDMLVFWTKLLRHFRIRFFLKLELLTFVCCHKILVAGTSNFTSSTMSSLNRLGQKYPSPMMPKNFDSCWILYHVMGFQRGKVIVLFFLR